MSKLIDGLFDQTIPGLHRSLDLYWKRNEAISSNVSNAETPQYRAVDVNFAGELERAFDPASSGPTFKTHASHIDMQQNGSSYFVEDLSGATRADGNNVDIDIQMGKLTYNSGKYSISASLVRKKLQVLREAIRFAMR